MGQSARWCIPLLTLLLAYRPRRVPAVATPGVGGGADTTRKCSRAVVAWRLMMTTYATVSQHRVGLGFTIRPVTVPLSRLVAAS